MRAFAFASSLSVALLGASAAFADAPSAPAGQPQQGAPAADDTTPPPLPAFGRPFSLPRADPYLTYRYVEPTEPQYFRAVLEGIGVLSVGYIEYLLATHQSDRGARVFYEPSIFHDKLSGNAQSFDANQFGTNFIGHPFGGTLYYLSARSNRLSVAQSFGWAFTGSLIWEYLGEIDEKPSYNDMIMTPWGGFALGETFTQLTSFFARGRQNFGNQALQILFGVPRTVHDWADDAEPEHAESTDALGFPNDIWHDFRADLAAGSTVQGGIGTKHIAGFDTRFGVSFDVRNLPHYGAAGKESRFFDDGNMAALNFQIGQSEGKIVDALFQTKIVPVGYYVHDAQVDERGQLRGQSGIVGVSFGYEYGSHDYDRDRRRGVDLFSKVTLLGLTGEYTAYVPHLVLRTRIDLGADFTGTKAYALPAYLEQHSGLNLPGVLSSEGYYYAAGPSVVPSITATSGPFELRAKLSWEDFTGITGIDVDQETITKDIGRGDSRVIGSARLAFRPVDALELGGFAEFRHREGRVADTREWRTERTLLGFVGARF